MQSYRVTMSFDLGLTDVEAVQRLAHQVMTEDVADGTSKGEMFHPGFESVQQAIDFTAQDERAAVNMAVIKAFAVGALQVLPAGTTATRLDIQTEPL